MRCGLGDNPGEHTVIFGLLGETLELSVQATNRDCYAHGAWRRRSFWRASRPKLYGMRDVLGI